MWSTPNRGTPGSAGYLSYRQVEMKNVLVLHGPNMNLLGKREPAIYGTTTLDEINRQMEALANERGSVLRIIQSNHEGVLIDAIHRAVGWAEGILINPAGLSYSSYSIRDAIAGVGIPTVEVHMSNIFARESFRGSSIIVPACRGQVCGFGATSYLVGLLALIGVEAAQ
jgi:3-dehydroquinate dehydratase-2